MNIFRTLCSVLNPIYDIASSLMALRDMSEYNHKELATTPKSVCAMTSILEPQIHKDFPEFSWREFYPDAQNLITEELEKTGASEIMFHRTEICDYKKEHGNCIVTLQSSLQYFPGPEENAKRGKRLRELPKQARYNSELIYIQDAIAYGRNTTASGASCPNCGAPVTSLGQKTCAYCGSAVTVINRHVWSLNRIYES